MNSEAKETIVNVENYSDGHMSDCATHNMPAYPNGECDCGYVECSK